MADNGLPDGFSLDQPAADQAPQPPSGFQLDEDKYGTPGQQALAGAEGAAQGVLGPIATYAETHPWAKRIAGRVLGGPVGEALAEHFNPTPEDIRMRADVNPVTHGLGKAVGFGLSAIGSVGAAPVVEGLGKAAANATGLGIEGASTISKIAAQGIKTGTEMAALQAGDELSKMITNDPGQSIGTAAINVGLSGLMGGVGGVVIGSVGPLWKASMEKMGVPKLIDDAKAQYNFRQSLPNGGDVPAAITDELTGRMGEVDTLKEQMSNLKGASLERAMPEVTVDNTARIDAQVQEIANRMTGDIEKASNNAYLKGAVPKLAQDFNDFLEVATNPNATYAEKFDAIDMLKRAQQAKSNYGLTAEDTALGNFTKGAAKDLRSALEDTQVWGDAAKVQKDVNAAIKSSIDAEKDAASRFTSKVMGERVADPTKVNTLVSQSLKGKAGVKTDIMKNYLEHTQELADTINEIHTAAGLEAPVRLTPTPALDHTLGRSSAGTNLGNWLYEKGLASVAGHAGGEAIGATLGSFVGHPVFGAMAGEKFIAPSLTSLAKPLLEGASHSEAFKGSLDYVTSVIRGERLLSAAAQNIFKSGAEVLPRELLPNVASREKLEKSIDYASNPDTAMNVGGNLGHYLPSHATAAASTAATASNYLKALKPSQAQQSPLDKPAPVDPAKQQQYERALDIAQQPLMVLQHTKHGTLQAQDVATIHTIYPNLHSKMVAQAYQEMTKAIADGRQIPFKQRQSLSLLMGKPLDSTLTQPALASVMMANAPKGPPQQQGGQAKRPRPASSSTEKYNAMYATPSQSRAAHRTGG